MRLVDAKATPSPKPVASKQESSAGSFLASRRTRSPGHLRLLTTVSCGASESNGDVRIGIESVTLGNEDGPRR